VILRAYQSIAAKLQEAAVLSNDNVRQRLQSALRDAYPDHWCYVVDVFGDDKAGQVVYCCDDELCRCAYSISSDGETSIVTIDTENKVSVVPRISYEIEDATAIVAAESLALVEGGCQFSEALEVREAKTDYEIKLIAPGKGATAFYPEEALRTSGPKVFKAGTHMYWNHPTSSEERERPERDLNTLAAVLTSDAEYKEGPKGPGLYARAKVFADYAEQVESKAGNIGLSIMASGVAETLNGKPVLKEGVPVLKEFTRAQSTDFVTRAGAGGLILTESENKEGANQMDAAELKQLQETVAEQAVDLRRLRERAAISDAATIVRANLSDLRISEAIAQRVAGRILAGTIPLTATGDLDTAKLKTLVEAEAKDECAYIAQLSNGRIVSGMGAEPAQLSETDRDEQKRNLDSEAEAFAAGLGIRTKEAQAIMTSGRSAFRADFNAADEVDE
jgi:hypothetical protein